MVRLGSGDVLQYIYYYHQVVLIMLFNCYSFFYSASYMCKRTYVFMEYEFDTMDEVRACANYYGVGIHFLQPKGLAFGNPLR